MQGTGHQVPAYRFGAFELDTRSGDLRKLGLRIKLQDQPREILFLLLDHAGEVVTREQIQKHLWPDSTFVDFDNAINSAVRKLRDALGDTADNPRFIETLARRGYRFIAPVSTKSESTPEPPPPLSTPAAPAPRGPNWRAVAAVVGTLIVIAVAARLVRTSSTKDIADVRVMPLTSNPGLEFQPSFSPDGTRIAYVWNGPDRKNFAIYVKLIGAGVPMRVTSDVARDFSPAWSADGRWIAALRDLGRESSVILIPASAGRPRELARVKKAPTGFDGCVSTDWPHICGVNYWGSLLAWSRDGKYIFTPGYPKPDSALAIIRISTETGEQHPITSPPLGTAGDFGPTVSADGRELAFVRSVSAKTGDLYVVPLSGAIGANAQARRLTFDSEDIESAAWTRDGRELIFSSSRGGRRELWRIEPSGSGKPVRLAAMGENGSDLAISPSGGRLVYSRGGYYGSLWKIPIEGGKGGVPVRVTESTARDKFSHFSPDGKRVAFQSARSGVDEIWLCDADGANAVQLTSFGRGMSGSPRWSPDGKTIAFDSNVAGKSAIYVIHAEGGQPRRVTTDPANAFIPSWSRDGQWIYFTSTRSGGFEIWRIRPDGSSETQVTTTGGALAAVESADSKYLYYKRGGEYGELWKMPVGGGPATKVLASIRGRMFTVTQNGIYFAAGAPTAELRYLNFATGVIRGIAPLGVFAQADVSADERWALDPRGGTSSTNLMLVEDFR